MKKTYILALILGSIIFTATPAVADDCQIDLTVTTSKQTEDVPEIILEQLSNRLAAAITATGIVSDAKYSRFSVTGKFSHIIEDVVPGPPQQTGLHTTLTLYVIDNYTQAIFATQSFELRGVGSSSQRAFINAMRPLNAKNITFVSFVEDGKDKILDYYDDNYSTIITQAEQAAKLRNFEEALFYLTAVPVCCKGYSKVAKTTVTIYDEYAEVIGKQLLLAAKAEWGACPDALGAERALEYIKLIDPYTDIYNDALKLADEISKSVKSDYIFETREKYQDEVAIEKEKIEAARSIGVAFGNGQKNSTTNIVH